jgi:uncharacterized MAPEG superfamily protein
MFGLEKISISGGLFLFFAACPPIMAAGLGAIKFFVVSAFSDSCLAILAASGVPAKNVPMFIAVMMVLVAWLSCFFALGVIAYCKKPEGYDNSMPRLLKNSAEFAKTYPVSYRLQCAHNNSLEALNFMTPCFWAAHTLGLEEVLFAKLAVMFLFVRLVYIVMYAVDSNGLRTTVFTTGMTILILMVLGGLWPSTLHWIQ